MNQNEIRIEITPEYIKHDWQLIKNSIYMFCLDNNISFGELNQIATELWEENKW